MTKHKLHVYDKVLIPLKQKELLKINNKQKNEQNVTQNL